MSMAGQTKTSATTLTVSSKNTTTLYGIRKAGAGWNYDDPYISYDDTVDNEGREILYDSIGRATTLTPITKNNA